MADPKIDPVFVWFFATPVVFLVVLFIVVNAIDYREKYVFTTNRLSRVIKARVISFSGCTDYQERKGMKNVAKVYTHRAWKDHQPGPLNLRGSRNKNKKVETAGAYFQAGEADYEKRNDNAGGLFTSTMLQIMYDIEAQSTISLTYQSMIYNVQNQLALLKFEHIPHIATSHPIKFNEAKFRLFPLDTDFKETAHESDAHVHDNPEKKAVAHDQDESDFNGTKRAVLIGISYEEKLVGTHNDVWNVKQFLKEVHGFEDQNMTILVDDGKHTSPTGDNIRGAYKKLTAESKSGDIAFCHYSGHGGRLEDDNGDELDGFDETLIPLDYKLHGHIRDDEVYEILVHPMAEGVVLTTMFDSDHSGSVMDLPYEYTYKGRSDPTDLGP